MYASDTPGNPLQSRLVFHSILDLLLKTSLSINFYSFFDIILSYLAQNSIQRNMKRRGEKWHEVWIIVEGSRSRKLHFLNICNLSPSIFQIYITIICSAMLLIHSLVIFVIEGDFSLPVPTCFSPLLFMFLWILFWAKYDKIMSKNE